MPSDNKNSSFFKELQRRNVYRVGVAYAIVTWLLLQVIDVILPILGLPEWAPKLVLTLLVIGFPMAMIFAWAYELTPEGLKREKDVDRSQSITQQTGRKLDRIIIGVLVVAVGMLLVDKFWLSVPQETTEVVTGAAPQPVDVAPSIAVLPFVNMSADESSTYFSDGLADTLLHMLAQIRELRVAARTSSFQFRDQAMDISDIGRQLNVGTVLEGSVQRAGDQIRITAQLIDVDNGYHLWSGNFDRNLDNIFVIQDEIATEVVSALKVSLLGEEAEKLTQHQTDNVDAYTEYLLGLNDLQFATSDNLNSAVRHLQEAIRIDPNYARAYSTLGRAYLEMHDYGIMRQVQAMAAARNAASRALDLSPDSSEALAVLGEAEVIDGNWRTGGEILQKAAEINPNDAVALDYLAKYQRLDAQPEAAMQTAQRALRIDPLSTSLLFNLAIIQSLLDREDLLHETIDRIMAIDPHNPSAFAMQSGITAQAGNLAASLAPLHEAQRSDPDDPEGFFFEGGAYLALEMPDEARRLFDRASEIDPEHPVSRIAPVHLNYVLQQNEEEMLRIARELLEDRIENRRGARFTATWILIDHAAETGNHDTILGLLDNLYPQLFDDPPRDLDRNFIATYFVGLALYQSGDIERGSHLLQAFLELRKPYDEVYGAQISSVVAKLVLGDMAGARQSFADVAEDPYNSALRRYFLEHSVQFDPLRNDPAFVELMDYYHVNAEKQRGLLQAMNAASY